MLKHIELLSTEKQQMHLCHLLISILHYQITRDKHRNQSILKETL